MKENKVNECRERLRKVSTVGLIKVFSDFDNETFLSALKQVQEGYYETAKALLKSSGLGVK